MPDQNTPTTQPVDNQDDLDIGTTKYTVQEGDTIKKIAEQFGMTEDELKSLNNIQTDDQLTPGMKITIKTEISTTDRYYTNEFGQEFTQDDLDRIINGMNTSNATIDNINTRLLGVPYQFLPSADLRINAEENIGRLFCQNMMAEAPIVTIQAGTADFLPDYSKHEKEIFGNLFQGSNDGDEEADSALKDLINEDNEESRYFGFKSDYSNYIKYVNLLCRVTAIMLGIGDRCPPGLSTPYKSFDWGNYKYFNNYTLVSGDSSNIFDNVGETIESTINGNYQFLSLYVDPSTSFSESTSNETAKSALEGKFDEMESKVKEYSFFAESLALGNQLNALQNIATSLMDGVASLSPDNTFLNSLLGKGKQQIIYGSNLIFPEIWQDSQYNKSYTISTEFVSPYGDKESIYINCLVPMMHLLALALPKQTTANTYTSPFLIKMFSKGWFSCEMGIVDSIQIEKGPDQAWSVDGLATTMKVTMSVKDLYSQLMISPSNSPFLFFSNLGLIEFLGATCGVDLSIPTIELKIKLAMALLQNAVTDLPTNWFRDIRDSVNNKLNNLLR